LDARLGARRWGGGAVAVLAVGVSLLFRLFLARWLGEPVQHYVLFYAAVIVTALLGGTGAGILATLLASFAIDYFFLDPVGSLTIRRVQDMEGLAIFTATNLMISVLAGAYRAVRRLSEKQALELSQQLADSKKTEQRLRLQSAALESASDAVVITDPKGTIQWVNEAFTRLTGFNPDEAVGRNPRILKSGKMPQTLYEDLWKTILAGRIWHGEMINRRKDGRFYTEAMAIAPVLNSSGTIINFVAIKTDITARRQAEEEARQAQDALARVNAELERRVKQRTAELRKTIGDLEHFSYAIVHDLRAPLRAMRSYSNMLLQESKGAMQDRHRKVLEQIAGAAQRMDLLIVDALDYSKAVRGELPLRTVDADALLRGMLETYPNYAPSFAQIQIEGRLGRVWGNEAGLTQCFSNLLDNAIKFVPPARKPSVRVHNENRGDRIRLWFEDNGIGVPPEMRDRIFQMFQRASSNYEGTGIGLALVRKVVERMGGSVGVESGPGNGSRFWLELRAADAPATEAS
jgi:PAS domain S-box-containing protein